MLFQFKTTGTQPQTNSAISRCQKQQLFSLCKAKEAAEWKLQCKGCLRTCTKAAKMTKSKKSKSDSDGHSICWTFSALYLLSKVDLEFFPTDLHHLISQVAFHRLNKVLHFVPEHDANEKKKQKGLRRSGWVREKRWKSDTEHTKEVLMHNDQHQSLRLIHSHKPTPHQTPTIQRGDNPASDEQQTRSWTRILSGWSHDKETNGNKEQNELYPWLTLHTWLLVLISTSK